MNQIILLFWSCGQRLVTVAFLWEKLKYVHDELVKNINALRATDNSNLI